MNIRSNSDEDAASIRARFLIVLASMLLAAGVAAVMGQEFRLSRVTRDLQGKVSLGFPSDPSFYFVLYRGELVTSIATPVAMAKGVQGDGVLVENSAAGSGAFYRARKVPITQPVDTDGDGIDDVYELQHVSVLNPLNAADAAQDLDGDGVSNLDEYKLGTDPVTPNGNVQLTTLSSSPLEGEQGVSVNRETILTFSAPLAADTDISTTQIHAEFGGRKILSRVDLSSDRQTVRLFYLEPLPGSARISVVIDGNTLKDVRGQLVDPDLDSRPGGVRVLRFDTQSNTPVNGTAVIGRVFASELAPDGSGNMTLNRPLAGVRVSVDGQEETLFTVTDVLGNFKLDPAPAGRFFVHVDGRTAEGSAWPNGSYFPVVGKAWEAAAGRSDNLAGGTGEIYLPFVRAGTLQAVSPTEDTAITFPPEVLQANSKLAGVSLTVPANSLYRDDGTRGGMVGIAAVPPDRLPEPLPPGLEFPVVITVQTDGGANFDRPVPVCFPNLPDSSTGAPLPPGAKNWLFSFNHDTGRWEPVGPMTVSTDGKLICTDPGVGILQPGWHGSGPPPLGPPPPPPPPCGSPNGPQLMAVTPAGLGLHQDSCSPCPPDGNQGNAAKCIRRCTEDGLTCTAGCTAAALAGIAACALAGPGFPVCAGGVLAAEAICLGVCVYQANVCKERCQEDNPPCVPGRAGLGGRLTVSLQNHTALAAPPANIAEDPTVTQIAGIVHEIGRLTYPSIIAGSPLPQNIADQVTQLLGQANSLAGGDALGYLRNYQLQLEQLRAPLEAEIGEAAGNAPPYPVLYLAEVARPNGTMLRLRGETGPLGQYSLFVPRDGTLLQVSFYDPRAHSFGLARPRVSPTARYRLPRMTLMPVNQSFPDSDADGLADVVELVYGTDPGKADSDGDGIKDGAEVEQGLDPLSGLAAQTGIIASADTPGDAVDICAINDLSVVADSQSGISIFNVFSGSNPVLVAQVDTPGTARAIACSGSLVAVADGPAGLAIVDISVPANARVIHQVSLGGTAQAVSVVGSIAYVGLNSGQLVSVDMLSGVPLEKISLASEVHDFAVEGDRLYCLLNTELRVYEQLSDGGLEFLGASPAPSFFAGSFNRLRRVFVGGGFAYVTSYPGYDTFDVRNPAAITKSGSASDVNVNSFKQIVANGSGLGVAAVGVIPRDDGTHDVYLYDTSDPAVTSRFLTLFRTPGVTHAVTIYNGLAYAADGPEGLQVINYLAYDNQGKPPTISLSTSFAGGKAEESKLLTVAANVSDDVQVRNVEFYIDGSKVATDGNFPFEHRFVTPRLTAAKTSFTLRAIASDTGGNTTTSELLTIQLVPDATPPRVKRTVPEGGAILAALDQVSAYFSEPINAATLNGAAFTVRSSGPDLVFGNGDDVPVTGGAFSYRGDVNAGILSFAGGLPAGAYQVTISAPLADLAGNAMAAPFTWTFYVTGGKDTDQDGIPDVVEIALGLDPNEPSSKNDGVLDGDRDLAGDGLKARWKILFGFDPRKKDSDGNGVNDRDEDPDLDGLANFEEFRHGTNPLSADTDGDGWDDNGEIFEGMNPLDPNTRLVVRVASAELSYLNAVLAPLPSDVKIQVASPAISFLNALGEPLPANVKIQVASPAISFLNALGEALPGNVKISISSPPASYLNALPDDSNKLFFIPSPVVSYRNE